MGEDLLDHPPDPGEIESPAAPASANGTNSDRHPLSYTSASGDRQSPSPAARELCDRLRFQLISETLDLISSYATSGAEAAWRGDRAMLELHLKQTRLSLLTAIETFKALGASFNTNTGEAA